MKIYNDNNIKTLLTLIERLGKRSMSNLIWRGQKLNIDKNEVIESVSLLLDLKVIREKEVMIGDGWNNRDTCVYYELAQ